MTNEVSKHQVAIIGNGYVGKAYASMFPDCVIYDEPQIVKYWTEHKEDWNQKVDIANKTKKKKDQHPPIEVTADGEIAKGREYVNNCELAIVCVPTNPLPNGELDMSIVEEVVGWIETPLILIKSALMPGTADRLIKETGKKIAVSPEFVGQGNYFIPPWKYPDPRFPDTHSFIIVGGEEKTATACAEYLWDKMSPDVKIHIVTALEAEIVKLVENFYGALKVTFINTLMSLTDKSGANFLRVHQSWQADARTDSMHLRTISRKRGWKSHCWDKDPKALHQYAKNIGADDMAKLIRTILELNKGHLKINENNS